MRNLIRKIGVAGLLATACSAAFAGNFTQIPDPAPVATGATVNIDFAFAGDGVTQDAQLDLGYNATVFTTVTATVLVVGSVCAVQSAMAPQFIRISPPTGGVLPNAATPYCRFAFTAAAGAAAANYDFTQLTLECSGPTCTRTGPFRITVTGGGANVPPNVTFAPAGGSTIVYSGAGAGAPIVVTPVGGSGAGAAATTTVGPCTITAGGPAFPVTTTNQVIFIGPTNTAQNIVLPNCVPQVAATNATLTCPVTQGAGAPANTVFTLTCPAAAVGAVPPTITYLPAPGASINVASAAATVIQVGCPTDGAAAVCNGSGVGLGATSRLENLTAVYAGPPFSPTPLMVCAFINEGGGLTAGTTLDFVAGQLDAGDIRCTCPTVFVQEPFTVTVRERIPASSPAITATRVFTINCGTGLVCPTLTAAPSSGVVSLVNGGANGLVTTYTVTGIQPGATQSINCVQSGAPAGSTFTVVTNPTPLVLTSATTSGTVSASCTNTNLATATAMLTCTPVSSAPGCTTLANNFTLSCPGAAAPPPVQIRPVPAMGEQSRILLAALMLLLGLAVMGFRARS